MKRLLIAGLALMTLVGCSSHSKNVIEAKSADYSMKAVFEDGVLTYLNENGNEFSKENLEVQQNVLTYDASENNVEPMLFYFETMNKMMNELNGELKLNGKPYQEQRTKLFEKEFKTDYCTYAVDSNSIKVNINDKNNDGTVKALEIEFISPVEQDKQLLNLSYLNMLNSMFGEGVFTIDDLKETDDDQNHKVVVTLTSELLEEKGLNQIELLDLINILKMNDFKCE